MSHLRRNHIRVPTSTNDHTHARLFEIMTDAVGPFSRLVPIRQQSEFNSLNISTQLNADDSVANRTVIFMPTNNFLNYTLIKTTVAVIS